MAVHDHLCFLQDNNCIHNQLISQGRCQCRYLHPSFSDQILLLHCILGVSLSQLHSIRSMDHLTVVACCTFSLMSFTCWPIFIHQDHLQSLFVFKFARVIFRVFSPIRSRVSSKRSSKCPITVSRCMRRLNKVPVPINFIITCSEMYFSSKPCFEEKQSILGFYV